MVASRYPQAYVRQLIEYGDSVALADMPDDPNCLSCAPLSVGT